jgi:hypothetical protein
MRLKRVLAELLEDNMQAAKLTKVDMARKIATRPPQLNRVLDASNVSAQLDTLIKAARARGRQIGIEAPEFHAQTTVFDKAPSACRRSHPSFPATKLGRAALRRSGPLPIAIDVFYRQHMINQFP